ncbi:WXG100 family type VII secretion target [bacterium]|nr:WXG100 family type VII secretion target [bacterium]
MAEKTIVNYDELQRFSKQFENEAESWAEMNSRTRQMLHELESEWIGAGSKKFFDEFENELMPALKRLHYALMFSSESLQDILKIFDEAENETANLFKDGSLESGEGLEGEDFGSGAFGTILGGLRPDSRTPGDLRDIDFGLDDVEVGGSGDTGGGSSSGGGSAADAGGGTTPPEQGASQGSGSGGSEETPTTEPMSQGGGGGGSSGGSQGLQGDLEMGTGSSSQKGTSSGGFTGGSTPGAMPDYQYQSSSTGGGSGASPSASQSASSPPSSGEGSEGADIGGMAGAAGAIGGAGAAAGAAKKAFKKDDDDE